MRSIRPEHDCYPKQQPGMMPVYTIAQSVRNGRSDKEGQVMSFYVLVILRVAGRPAPSVTCGHADFVCLSICRCGIFFKGANRGFNPKCIGMELCFANLANLGGESCVPHDPPLSLAPKQALQLTMSVYGRRYNTRISCSAVYYTPGWRYRYIQGGLQAETTPARSPIPMAAKRRRPT